MFLDFFFKLKDARIPVTLNEFFTFLDTVKLDFIQYNTENFYYMARASLVKDERLIDRFDVVFGEYFKGVENIKLEDVDLINTHGTSTPLGDVAELKAIDHIFGDHAPNININSTKSMTGHLLGAAGAVEAISVILSLNNGIVPPTINHQNIDENINPKLNLTLNKPQKRDSKIGMSNTFGFGGHNACVLFKKWD